MQATEQKNTDRVIIAPYKLNYGVISAGFLYNLKFTVQNNSASPMRIRVQCTPLKGENNTIRLVHLPDIIAPGLATTLLLELTAEFPMSSRFMLTVTQNHTTEVFSKEVEANVVTTQTFKHVKKSLVLQKRPIYQPNVKVVANIPDFDTMMEDLHNYSSSATFSEAALLDEDDIDDLLSLPMVHNVYWDPFSKCLRLDPTLGKVCHCCLRITTLSIFNTPQGCGLPFLRGHIMLFLQIEVDGAHSLEENKVRTKAARYENT